MEALKTVLERKGILTGKEVLDEMEVIVAIQGKEVLDELKVQDELEVLDELEVIVATKGRKEVN